jgi:hypothetical protein
LETFPSWLIEQHIGEGKQEPKCHIVLPSKRVIMGVKDKTDKFDDYDQFDGMPPFAVDVDPSISLRNEETLYLRHDHDFNVEL